MTPEEIKTKIADLEKRAKNPSLPASAVTKINGMIADLKAQIKASEKPEAKAEPKKAEPKKAEPKKAEPKKAETSEKKGSDDYDCDELIAKVKERRAKAKARAKVNNKKSDGTKAKEKVERVHSVIEKQVESGKLAKAQLQKLIAETRDLLKMLEKAYKSSK